MRFLENITELLLRSLNFGLYHESGVRLPWVAVEEVLVLFLSGVELLVFLDFSNNRIFKCFVILQFCNVVFNLLLLFFIVSQHN